MQQPIYNILSHVEYPSDLRKLSLDQLEPLCDELRRFLIDSCSVNPGHFGASLGVVELTVALHYAYNTPNDRIIWDVGHQAYIHKILTGRRAQFSTNRKLGGLSGFPKMSESEFDAFGTGHSSTSISAALGMAEAAKLKGETKKVIAVIGDGSLTGGMSFEGLNNAGNQRETDLLVILNDNNMAIDPNVGALNDYLLDITTSRTYNSLKKEVWNMLGKMDRSHHSRRFLQQIENGIKSLIINQSNLFEALNMRYFGPVDGHDIHRLVPLLNDLKNLPGPKLLHVVTVKGKGYKFAEENKTAWHAPGFFNKETGEIIKPAEKDQPTRYQDVFGYSLLELARKNDRIVGITPAMSSGSSLNIMMAEMPKRTYDVGIAEQHAVTFAAGLAAEGAIPFCNIYSSFMQRAYDQVLHDVALQNLPVIFCLDRAGLVGDDGPTHHGVFDIAYLRSIPDMTICSPINEVELRNLMYTAQTGKHGPIAIRYPRGRGVLTNWKLPFEEIEIGKGQLLYEGEQVAICSYGPVGNFVTQAIVELEKENIRPAHYDLRFAKPLDEELLHTIFKRFDRIITVEDGVITGGVGSALLEFMSINDYCARVVRLGVPDAFVEHGTQDQLYHLCGFDALGIAQAVRKLWV